MLAADENNQVWLLDTVMRLAATTGYGGFGLNEYNALRTYGMAARPHLTGAELTWGISWRTLPWAPTGRSSGPRRRSRCRRAPWRDTLAARERKLRLSQTLFDALPGTEGRFHVLVGIDDSSRRGQHPEK